MYQTPFNYNRKTTIHVATYNKSTDSVKDIRSYPGLFLSASNQYATTLEYRTNVYCVDGLARLYEMKYGNISGAAGSYYEYTYNASKYSFSKTDEYSYDSWGNENEIKNSNLRRVFLYGSKGKTDSGVHQLFWLYECTTEIAGKTYDQAMNYFDSLSVTSVTLNKTSAEITVNSSVTLSATVKAGSAVDKGVTWTSSNEKVATVNKNGKVIAKAYGTATITAASKADPSVKAKCKIQTRFIDATKDNVSAGMFKAIYWVADQKITGEKVRFGTNNSMTRGQFVRFLYRYAGEPKVSSATNPFSDIDKNYTHYDAILWAVKKGLINGYKEGGKQVFKPNDPLTRNHVATILWKYAGSPKVSNAKNPFTDVKSSTPIAWGKSKGIFTGTTFRPKENCLRGDFAVFLYRFDKNK